MSTEELVEKFGAQITRRNFLAKLGAGAVGALLGLMGFPNVAFACINYKCCCLCELPTSSCQQDCPYSWCWFCNYLNFVPIRAQAIK